MPAILTFLAVFNFNVSMLNYWYTKAPLTAVPSWNTVYGYLSIIGILPSFILVPLGLISMILPVLLTPVLLSLDTLGVVFGFVYLLHDPSESKLITL